MNTPLWTLEKILRVTRGHFKGKTPPPIMGISIDTRTLGEGDLFVPLQGDNKDGHLFVPAAFIKKASAALVSLVTPESEAAGPLIVVDDPLKALRALAKDRRASSQASIVAITGSVGKTSTKEMFRHVLSHFDTTHASVASYNNHWGVPLSLARMPQDSRFGVFEIGMNHKGEITPLTQLVRPSMAVITEIAESHLGNFKDLSEIADAKAEIFQGVVEGGSCFLNRDTIYYRKLLDAAQSAGLKKEHCFSFGRHPASDVRFLDCRTEPKGSAVKIEVFGRKLEFFLPLLGEHLALNALSVFGTLEVWGLDLSKAQEAFLRLEPLSGRGKISKLHHPKGGYVWIVDESYNANPASMRAAFSTLVGFFPEGGRRKIAVLGDMLELGDFGPDLHKSLSPLLEASAISKVYLSGPLMRGLYETLSQEKRGGYKETPEALLDVLSCDLLPGDIVLVKGSSGSRMKTVVQGLRG